MNYVKSKIIYLPLMTWRSHLQLLHVGLVMYHKGRCLEGLAIILLCKNGFSYTVCGTLHHSITMYINTSPSSESCILAIVMYIAIIAEANQSKVRSYSSRCLEVFFNIGIFSGIDFHKTHMYIAIMSHIHSYFHIDTAVY